MKSQVGILLEAEVHTFQPQMLSDPLSSPSHLFLAQDSSICSLLCFHVSLHYYFLNVANYTYISVLVGSHRNELSFWEGVGLSF